MRFGVVLAFLLTTAFATELWSQGHTGPLQVSTLIEGTKKPIPDVSVSLRIRIGVDCGACSLPDTEEELLAWLRRLRDATPEAEITAVTDKEGNAIFRDLKPGHYDVVAKGPGLLGPTKPDGLVRPTESSTIVKLEKESPNLQVVLFLTPSGVVSGRLLDSSGAPVTNVLVAPGVLQNGEPVYSTAVGLTDTQGEFILPSLVPGQYFLRVTFPSSPVRVVFFPGVASVEEAELILLEAGRNIVRFDLNLAPVRP
jgi:hypothetical protein